MKGFRFIVLLLLTVFLAACHDDMGPDSSGTSIGITLEFPEPVLTKADEGEVAGSAEESRIHDLQIWIFHSGTKQKVAYLKLDANNLADDFPQPGSVKKYTLPVSWDFALERPRPTVDVFVLANAASVDLVLGENAPYDIVNDAAFEGDELFSPVSSEENPLVQSVDPDKGLPMSGVAKGLTIEGEEPSLRVATVSLVRCVSKIRFLFCQMLTTSDNPAELETFQVDRVELDPDMIPQLEYVFASPAAPRVGDDYVGVGMSLTGEEDNPLAETVASSGTPELYAYGGQDGPTYERIIQDAKTDGKITDCGTVYLRESPKKLSGTIYYTVITGKGTASQTSREGTARFNMSLPGDFSRNHTWTVYGYYVSKRSLQLSISVLPWDKSDYTIKFSEEALMVTWKLSVLQQTVDSYEPIIGMKDHYRVTLKRNQPANAYLFVATPQGGRLQVDVEGENGSENAFDVWFKDEPTRKSRETTIDPGKQHGRIDIMIDRTQDEHYSGSYSGKTITLSFKAFTPDGDREIAGASECIDQVYHFILP